MSNPATPNLRKAGKPNLHGVGTANSPPAKGEYPEGGRGFLPKLRFPEFRDADWRHDHVGNLTSITKGKGISKADVEAGGSIPCIRYAELYTHYDEVIHEIVSRTNLPKEDLVLSQAGDVIIPASGETKADIAKAACVLAEGVALGSDLNVLRSELYGPFLSYLLNSPLRHHIARVAQGDTVAHLYPKQISQVRLAYPARLEQQKIADCLNSLDDLIAAEDRKLEALRRHKQGLMQQLFPRAGETVPRLRFPEFRSAGNWRRDHIGNFASITKGKGISKADIESGGSVTCIRYAELYTHYGEVIHEVVSRTNLPKEKLVLSQAEDVIIPASGETRADIAKAACVLAEGVALGSDLNVLRSDLYGPFFSYLLNSPVRQQIARVAQGDTVAHLYPKQISQVGLAYPSRLEQQRIAACLSSLDKLIRQRVRKLETLRQHKQGLMQQLFPSPEHH